jgi:hypothetical protein
LLIVKLALVEVDLVLMGTNEAELGNTVLDNLEELFVLPMSEEKSLLVSFELLFV